MAWPTAQTVLIVGYLIGRNTWNSKQWPMGCDSLPSAAREFRCCRQPKRISIARSDYVGVWRLCFAFFGTWLQGPPYPSTIFAERSTSERRLGAVSAENASSGH